MIFHIFILRLFFIMFTSSSFSWFSSSTLFLLVPSPKRKHKLCVIHFYFLNPPLQRRSGLFRGGGQNYSDILSSGPTLVFKYIEKSTSIILSGVLLIIIMLCNHNHFLYHQKGEIKLHNTLQSWWSLFQLRGLQAWFRGRFDNGSPISYEVSYSVIVPMSIKGYALKLEVVLAFSFCHCPIWTSLFCSHSGYWLRNQKH